MAFLRNKKTGDGGSAAHRIEVVHGTLLSDLDEPATLPAEFDELISAFGEQRVRYERSELSKQEFGEIIAKMTVTTADGLEWTLGASSGLWYQRTPGAEWEPAAPPTQEEDQSTDDDLLDLYFAGDPDLTASPDAKTQPSVATQNETLKPEKTDEPARSDVDEDETPAILTQLPAPTSAAADVVGLPAAPDAAVTPFPSVSASASESSLPEMISAEHIDADGVWTTGWEASTDSYETASDADDDLPVAPEEDGGYGDLLG